MALPRSFGLIDIRVFSSVSLIGGLKGGTTPKLDLLSVLGTRIPRFGGPVGDALAGGLIDRRFGALALVKGFRSVLSLFVNPREGDWRPNSGVRVPNGRCRPVVSTRDKPPGPDS